MNIFNQSDISLNNNTNYQNEQLNSKFGLILLIVLLVVTCIISLYYHFKYEHPKYNRI
jgi:hypothetical protein